jgi:antitoxin MazE
LISCQGGNYNVITQEDRFQREDYSLRLELTRIGNSRGIRIPKPLIAQCGLGDVVEVRVTSEGLILSPHRAPRRRWKQAFAASHPENAKGLLDRVPRNAFDAEEWQW